MAVYKLVTGECDCEEHYSGTNDRLVRVSAASIKPKCILHFVTTNAISARGVKNKTK